MLRMQIRDIALTRPRFDCPRIHIMLSREGWQMNHKRVRGPYRLGFTGADAWAITQTLEPASRAPGQKPVESRVWSIDFIYCDSTSPFVEQLSATACE